MAGEKSEIYVKQPPFFRAARAVSAIGMSTVAALLAGFFLQLTIAYKFGASGRTDAFFMAQGTSELLAKILLGGSITSVFLPVFVEYLSNNQNERAWNLANNLFHVAAVIFTVLLVILEIFTNQLVFLIAPGFSPEIHGLTVLLLRIILPAFFFTMLVDLGAAILNSLRVFGWPAISRLLTPLISLVLVVIFADRLGIITLAFGALAGGSLQLLLIVYSLKRAGFQYRFKLSIEDPDLKRVLFLVTPFIFSILAAQGAGIIYRILASHLPAGSLSAIKFGDKISQMTTALFLANIVTVSFPAFSRAVATNSRLEIIKNVRQAFRAIVFFAVPLTLGVILLREQVIRLLYERGSFTADDTGKTALVLGILLCGLLANSLSSLFGHLALALKATRVSVFSTIVTQIMTSALFLFLAPRLGIVGLALGSAISPFILVSFYIYFLNKRIPQLWHIFLDSNIYKIISCGIALFLAVYSTRGLIEKIGGPTSVQDVTTVILGAMAGSLAYACLAFILKIPELSAMKEIVYYAIKRMKP